MSIELTREEVYKHEHAYKDYRTKLTAEEEEIYKLSHEMGRVTGKIFYFAKARFPRFVKSLGMPLTSHLGSPQAFDDECDHHGLYHQTSFFRQPDIGTDGSSTYIFMTPAGFKGIRLLKEQAEILAQFESLSQEKEGIMGGYYAGRLVIESNGSKYLKLQEPFGGICFEEAKVLDLGNTPDTVIRACENSKTAALARKEEPAIDIVTPNIKAHFLLAQRLLASL